MGNERDAESDRPVEARQSSDSSVASKSAMGGMEDLVAAQKQRAAGIKAGEIRTGVTGDVPKVDFFDSAGETKLGKPSEVIGQSDQAEEGKSFKTPNGTQIEAFPDGSAAVSTPDGKVRFIDKEGKVFEQQSDGSTKEVQNSGISMRDTGTGDRTVVIKNQDGSTTEVPWGGGHVVTDYGNGKTVSNFEDGTQHTDLPGRRIIEHPPEKPYELHDNGVIIRPSPDGKPEPSAGGPGEWRTEEVEGGGTRYVNADRGEILIVRPDGSYEHHTKDPDGTQHRVSYDPHSRAIVDEYNEKYESNGGGYVKHRIVKSTDGSREDTDGSMHPNKKR